MALHSHYQHEKVVRESGVYYPPDMGQIADDGIDVPLICEKGPDRVTEASPSVAQHDKSGLLAPSVAHAGAFSAFFSHRRGFEVSHPRVIDVHYHSP